MTEHDAYIALNMMEKVGPIAVRSLVTELGSAAAIFEADESALRRAPGVGPETASTVLIQASQLDVAAETQRAESLGIRLVAQVDEEYPEVLRNIHDPPLALYVRGAFQSRDRHGLAVVGTRRPSHYGRDITERLAGQLAQAGYTIVSGLAEGIDTVAHRAALKAGGRSIGVLGGGMDCMYPRANEGLAAELAESGAVLSEFPLGRRPDRTTFPMRNRIVSGLSRGCLVVEAGRESGALITARQAMEQGRQVFAVPGRIDSPRSSGCHDLIRDGVALVRSVDDILEEFDLLGQPAAAPRKQDCRSPQLSDKERDIISALEEGELDVDALTRHVGLSAAAMSAALLGLEMKRVVKMRPGRTVELVNGIA